MISAKSPKKNVFDLSGNHHISLEQHNRNPRTALRKGDVILSTVGTIGNCAVVDEAILPANSDRHVGIVRPHRGFKPYFLSTFFLSKFGRFQTLRESTGNVQLNLFIYKIRELKIPSCSIDFQQQIENLVLEGHEQLTRSQVAYEQAENILLEHLGIKGWQPSEAGVSVKSFAEAFGAERLDPEYYRPKFDELENIVSAKENVQPLGEFLVVNARGKQPSYTDDGVLVVNSKHVRTGKVIVTDNRRATLEKGALTIRKGDVLINGTGVGTIGRCAPYFHDEIALPDNHVTILRTNELDPVYLSAYLNSPAGQLQVDKHFKGSSGQIELYPDQIANFYVWKAPTDVQKQIREKVEASYQAEQLSEQLLDLAKRGVERAIEESEAAALAGIEAQLAELGVDFSTAE